MSAKLSKLQEQIPLYINGAIQKEERAAFEQSLKQNSELKQEYIEFHEIESVFGVIEDVSDQHFEQLFLRIQANAKFEPPPSPAIETQAETQKETATASAEKPTPVPPPEKSGERTKPETAAVSSATNAPPGASKPHEDEHEEEHVSMFSKEHLNEFFTSARLAWGVVIAQFIFLVSLMLSSPGNGFTAIGLDGKPIKEISTINVVFADNATQKEIRELLANIDAQIANGPTSIGLYTIYIKGNETNAKNVIDRLKKSTLILLAEPAFI